MRDSELDTCRVFLVTDGTDFVDWNGERDPFY